MIYNGVDTKCFECERPQGALAKSPCVAGCVARLSAEKGHYVLLSATRQLIENGADMRLRLIGDGPARRELQQQAQKLGIGGFVRFMGARDDVPALLRDLDVFVLPSFTEGLPLTILEAMASGLPVVATAVGGVPEMVQDGVTGFLVPPEDVAALADAIGRLVENPDLRQRMGRAGREVAVSRFDLRVAARKHEELYLRLLAEKGVRVK